MRGPDHARRFITRLFGAAIVVVIVALIAWGQLHPGYMGTVGPALHPVKPLP